MSKNLTSLLVSICIILTSSLVVCEPIPATAPPQDISYDLKKVSLLQQDPEKQPSKELIELADLQKNLNNQDFIEYIKKLLKKQEKHDAMLQEIHGESEIHDESLFKLPQASDESTKDESDDVELMQADALSTVTRYVGVGYNLLRGNPEGDYDRGGIDPGIKITKHILKFTYDQGKQAFYRGATNNLPDQVQIPAIF